jgi:hypothetical protein
MISSSLMNKLSKVIVNDEGFHKRKGKILNKFDLEWQDQFVRNYKKKNRIDDTERLSLNDIIHVILKRKTNAKDRSKQMKKSYLAKHDYSFDQEMNQEIEHEMDCERQTRREFRLECFRDERKKERLLERREMRKFFA